MNVKSIVAVVAAALLLLISSYAQAQVPALSPAAAEVVKLAGAGTGEDVVLAYVQNSQVPFELTADHVLYLKDLGLPSPVVAAMLNRDAALREQAPPQPVEAPPPAAAPPQAAAPAYAPAAGPEGAPPRPPSAAVAVSAPPADVGYFYNDLAPYGTWVDLPGAGWCWQPTVVTTVGGWQPYLHGGYWMNTDAGWFWASDYSWGWAPFHYGRWQMHPTAGWVWFPGRVWGPSWVVWRSGGGNCGWAPLPPRADFVAGIGWSYNGVHVSANFDFGLSVGCFSFVSMGHFGEHNLYNHCLPRTQVTQVYRNTTVINNVTYVNNTYVNHGINVNEIERAGGRKFERVKVSESSGSTASTGGAYRHPLPKPAPISTLTATKVDARGRIPLGVPASTRLKGATLVGSGSQAGGSNTGNAGGQKGTTGLSNVKGAGATRDFSSDKLDNKNRAGGGLSSNPKLNPTSGGNANQPLGTTGQKGTLNSKTTSATHDFSSDKVDNKARPGSTLPSNTRINPTGSSAVSVGKPPGSVGASAGAGSSSKISNVQGTSPRVQGEVNPWNKQVNPGDARGATGLTTREFRKQNNDTTGDKGVTGSSGAVNRYGSNPNVQRPAANSSGASKTYSGSGANKNANNNGPTR